MLPKQNRLTVAAFNRFFKRGKRHHGQYMTLIYTPDEHFSGAVVVGKKVYKRAVDRNRLRRQLYPVLQLWHTQHAATGAFQCLLKPTANTQTADVLRTELQSLLAQATKRG